MRHSYTFLLFLLIQLAPLAGWAQSSSVGIGTTSPDPKAALDISATGKGLLIPRMDSATRAGITAPPDGLMVFQTNGRKGFWYAVSGAWVFIPDKTKSGDNLGTHTATQDLNLNGHQLTGGGSSGLALTNTGHVGIGTTTPTGALQVTVTQPGAEIVDQQQTSTTTSIGFSSITNLGWQSFTPAISGSLTRLEVRMISPLSAGPSPATLNIFAGEGTTGTLLASQPITISVGFAYQPFVLTTAMPVVAGQQYTFQLLPPVVNQAWLYVTSANPYSGGRSGVLATADLVFTTSVTPNLPYDALAVMPSGQVGIGTSSPLASLDINGTTRTTGFQLTSGGAAGRVLTSDAGGTATWQAVADPSATNELQIISKTGATVTLSNGGGSFTDSDNQTLSIAGSTISLSNGGGSVTVPSSADNLGNHSATQNLNLGANLLTGGGSTGLRVTSGGLVGIGTAAPSGLLHMVGSDATTNGFGAALRLQNTAATTANTWTVRAGGAGTATPDGGFSIADNNNYRLSITNGGLVGIGTTAPAARLTVSGADATAHGKNAAIMLQNTSASTANTWTVRAGGIGTATPDGGFSIGDDTNYRLTITSAGWVGIGTTAPASELDVAGNLRLQGQSSTTEGLLVADAQGDVQRARHYAYTKSGLLGGASQIHTRTHNLGYAPIWLISIECDASFPTLSVTYENTSVNQTVFHVFNHGLIPLDYTIHAFPVQ